MKDEDFVAKLPEKDQQTLNNMSKFQQLKFVRAMPVLYNSFCEKCKRKVLANPKMDLSEYCDSCRTKAVETIRKICK